MGRRVGMNIGGCATKGKKCGNKFVEYNIACDRTLDKYNIM